MEHARNENKAVGDWPNLDAIPHSRLIQISLRAVAVEACIREIAIVGQRKSSNVGRAGTINLVNSFAANDTIARRIIDPDAAIIPLEHEELMVVQRYDGR